MGNPFTKAVGNVLTKLMGNVLTEIVGKVLDIYIPRKKLTENKSTSQIAQETHHTPEAVDRYLKGLSQVIFCTERGMSIKDTSFITSMSEGLVKQYTKLAKSLKPDKINCLKHGSDGKET